MFESNTITITSTRKRTKYSGSLEKGLLESLMKDKSPRICLLSVQGKSDVWSLFKRIVLDDEETRYVQCQECGNIMIHDNSTGTGGLKRHNCLPKQRKTMARLTNAVGPMQVQWKKEMPFALNVSTASTNSSLNHPNYSDYNRYHHHHNHHHHPHHIQQQQQQKLLQQTNFEQINSSFINPIDFLSALLKKEISKVGAFCIAKDLKPYNFMEGNGFELLAQNLINIGARFGNVDAKQLLPNALTISKSINEIYEKLKDSLRNELSSIEIVSSSCDAPINSSKYIIVNIKYFKQRQLVKRVLGAVKSENEKFSDIGAKIINVFEEFDLMSKIKICVCKNASAFLQSSNEIFWVDCAAKNLNLVFFNTLKSIKDDPMLKTIHNLIYNSQQLIAFWKNNALNEPQIKFESTNDNLISIVNMLQFISRHWIQLMEIRERNEKLKSYLDAIDKNLLNYIANILTIFKEVKETLCDEKVETFHLVLPTKAKLIKKCESSSLDDCIIQKFKECLKENIEKYFTVSIFHKCATLLVPSFRGLKNMADNYEKQKIFEMIKKLRHEWHKSSNLSCSYDLSPKKSHSSKNNIKTIFNSFNNTKSGSNETASHQMKLQNCNLSSETNDELEIYLKDNLASSELISSPMEFWEFKKNSYPNLYEIAKLLFLTPASTFSNSINLCHDFENNLINLEPNKVSQLFFIRSNMENF